MFVLVLTEEQHGMLLPYFAGVKSKPSTAGGKVTYRLTAQEFQTFQANQSGGGGAMVTSGAAMATSGGAMNLSVTQDAS